MSRPRNEFRRKIDSTQVLEVLLTLLLRWMSWKLDQTRITRERLLQVLAYASVHQTSIDVACRELGGAPSANRVREVLHSALPVRPLVQREVNSILRAQVPKHLFKRKRDYCIAIDITLIPYHGRISRDDPEVVRAHAKQGTNPFHGYATVSIVHDKHRYVLALRFVQPHESMSDIVRDLLDRVERLNIAIRRVYLDKEFYAVNVFRTLDRRGLAYIVAVPMKTSRKRKNGRKRQPTALEALCRGRKGYSTCYTLHPRGGQHYTVQLTLVKRNRRPGQKKVVRWFLYAVAGLPPKTIPHGVFELYRYRLGIETSYRQLHQVRARTSSQSATLRLLFVGLALILINLYLTLRQALQTCSPTGERCPRGSLSLRRLGWLLGRAIESLFGPTALILKRPVEGFS